MTKKYCLFAKQTDQGPMMFHTEVKGSRGKPASYYDNQLKQRGLRGVEPIAVCTEGRLEKCVQLAEKMYQFKHSGRWPA